ncbi:hypothetical protein UFOVP422_7 [uncultured Caudovirales phage]|uniref:Terminase small subunit n=1 Tax=uncultured Caudovirales phage TaxID=2100421 RepID=A0A6J5MDL6_9CAUD|nr:hypothetical protein UFOVP422_7 [uncultured Caudovirales phage]
MKAKLEEAERAGMYIEQLATHLGIHDETIREWEAIHPEFSAAVKKIRQACRQRVASLLDAHAYGGIEKGNGSVAIFIAKNVLGWRDRSEVEQTVKQTQEINVTIGGARRSSEDENAPD